MNNTEISHVHAKDIISEFLIRALVIHNYKYILDNNLDNIHILHFFFIFYKLREKNCVYGCI